MKRHCINFIESIQIFFSRKIHIRFLLLLVACSIGISFTSCNSCSSQKTKKAEENSIEHNIEQKSTVLLERQFPEVEVPAILNDNDKIKYISEHFWDKFLDTTKIYLCDSVHVNGIKKEELNNVFKRYIILSNLNLDPSEYLKKSFDFNSYRAEYQHNITLLNNFFDNIYKFQRHFPESNLFSVFTSLISTYLYNPNSLTRNEELYHAYVKKLLQCPIVSEEDKMIYEYDKRLTGLNRVGTKASNLQLKDVKGKVFSIYDFKSEYTVLIFINPGCNSCKAIIDQLKDSPEIVQMVKNGNLTIVTAYIDKELELWRENIDEYSNDWYNGYDFNEIVRNDLLYNVRSIPSIYLLDSEKNVILKDMPETVLFNFLNRWNIDHL